MNDFLDDFDEWVASEESNPKSNGANPIPEIVSPTNRPAANGNGHHLTGNPRAYALGALRGEVDRVAYSTEGSRNDSLNRAAFSLASLVTAGHLSREEVFDALYAAGTGAGLNAAEVRATLASGERGSAEKVGARVIPDRPATAAPGTETAPPDAATPEGRHLVRIGATSVSDDVPTWAWTYGGKGRIQLGTLALFAGRPGAGKSTAARWFAAQVTLGRLDGCWYGTPRRVAYIAPAEESLRYVIKPGLRAVGADLSLIDFPQMFLDDEPTRLLSVVDEARLTAALLEWGSAVVIVDPLMSTIGASVDVHRNNEVRAYVEPWARIADAINGVVAGVVHLRKDTTGDPVAAINGSSAFGEVARAVFGFAKDPESEEGDRVLSQAKNSTGFEDLALTYRIGTTVVRTDSGAEAEVGTFEIIGESEMTVGDILSGGMQHGEAGAGAEARRWLEDYLTEAGCEPSKSVKAAARKEGISEPTLKRAAQKLRVVVEAKGFPRITFWSLPRSQSAQWAPNSET